MNRRAERGFTLIEVMAAVVILAMALAAIIAGFSRQASLSADLRDRTLAMMVARNRLAEYTLAAEFPDTDESEGERSFADNEWEWFAEVSETEDPALRRIDLRVRREGGDRDLATLSGFVAETGRQ
jgi:general secretion pathway protein I